MIRRASRIAIGAALAVAPLVADFSYEQTTKITGGAMAGMMRVAGVFSKTAREPIKQTVIVKGDRMVNLTADTAHITDLGKETITDINFKNKTYSVITFAQMRQAMAQLQEKMKSQKAPEGADRADVDFKASVKETGQTKVISGLTAKEVILTLEMQVKDRESGKAGAMDVVSDMWLAPQIPGYGEVRDFYRRMAEKMAWAPGAAMGGMGQSQPGMMKGMAELAKESAKLDGVPVLQIMRMGSSAQAMADFSAPAQPQQQGQGQQETPSVRGAAGNAAGNTAGNAAGNAATGAIAGRLGRLGGIGGGLGGLRRGKQQSQPEPPPQPPPQQAPPAQAQGGPPAGILMESTTELSGFSSAPADPSKVETPAGYKQVENEMLKQT
ncbi:MAG: hypothetical protein NT090_24250, partial [Acidobacteria bacterium]|nr:hypothetical protein [Acidobacteriota bacterium]